MSVRASELRKGSVIEKDGDLLLITDYHHHTPGNLRSIFQMKTKSLKTGSSNSLRASASDTFELAYLDKRRCQYLYREANGDYIFMDGESFEQFPLPGELAEGSMGFVKESTDCDLTFHDGNPIGLELPTVVELEVTEAEMAVKGNTATNVKKDAVVETGLAVKVPLHVSVGDKIKIRTSDAEFMGRSTD